jgi:hypothetical protein
MTNPFEKPSLVPDDEARALFEEMRRSMDDPSIVEKALAAVPDKAVIADIKRVARSSKPARKAIEPNTGMEAMRKWQEDQEKKQDEERERWEKAA